MTVEDSGTGMSANVRARVFDPFFTTKPRERGTGLGMAVVHGIVHDHEGRIDITTAEGEGTRVTVALPCCDPPDAGAAPADRGAPPGEPAPVVLVVEDRQQLRAIIAATLTSAGYEVVSASDGVEAVEALAARSQETRLVILDVDMPREGGLACIRKLHETRPDLPAILMAGADLNDEGMRNVALLRKPFAMPELVTLARRMVAARPTAKASGDAAHQGASSR